MHFRGASGAIIVYDVTEKSSFERAKWWLEQVLQIESGQQAEQDVKAPDMQIFLVGNKCDLDMQKEVSL